MTSSATLSSVLLPVPAAEALVQVWRDRYDQAASWGVPAHVTLLYPFVPPEAIDGPAVDRLRALFRGRGPVDITLAEVRRFGDHVLYLAPESDAPIRSLTEAIVHAFPACPPYGGAFDTVIPHLTVTDGAPLDVMAAAEAEVRPRLPIRCSVPEAWLMTGREEAGSWRVLECFPLGA